MDRTQTPSPGSPIERQLAHLKILSRLLSHELRAQSGPRLTLSREEVHEIQTSLDLYIEDAIRRKGGAAPLGGSSGRATPVEVQTVPARVN